MVSRPCLIYSFSNIEFHGRAVLVYHTRRRPSKIVVYFVSVPTTTCQAMLCVQQGLILYNDDVCLEYMEGICSRKSSKFCPQINFSFVPRWWGTYSLVFFVHIQKEIRRNISLWKVQEWRKHSLHFLEKCIRKVRIYSSFCCLLKGVFIQYDE